MKHSLPERIRHYRKELSLTQEALAEALRVTVGTISKWENGITEPDLSTLTDIANFFSVSLDALCGYQTEAGNAAECAQKIRSYYTEERFSDGSIFVETALKKYPHDFRILYRAGTFYMVRFVVEHIRTDGDRAIHLLRQALDFLEQNDDERIGELSIRREIADIYAMVEETDLALNEYKETNHDGINDVRIGAIYSKLPGKEEEALSYLSAGFITVCAEQISCVFGMINVFLRQSEYGQAQALLEWAHHVLQGLIMKDQPSYFRRIHAIILAILASIAAMEGRENDMRSFLKKAHREACAFDRMPSYSTKDIRFVFHKEKDKTTLHDSVPTSAIDAVDLLVRKQLYPEHGSAKEKNAHKKLVQAWKHLSDDMLPR